MKKLSPPHIFILLTAALLFRADNSWALQSHSAQEGIYVHQLGYLLSLPGPQSSYLLPQSFAGTAKMNELSLLPAAVVDFFGSGLAILFIFLACNMA